MQPRLIVDSTTISPAAAEGIRAAAEARGTAMLAAPVSGNPKVAASGRLTIVTSGPADAWEEARPYLELLCRRVTYVGEGERARLVKICHNLMLGVVAQCLAEITVLAEKGGVSRADFLEFLNDSVMGSTFTRYKSPAYVNLDFTPTFTPELLLKDFHLGFEAARALNVAMPLAAATEQIVQGLVGIKGNDVDFAALIELSAQASGLELEPEDVEVDDGLSPLRAERERCSSADAGQGVGVAPGLRWSRSADATARAAARAARARRARNRAPSAPYRIRWSQASVRLTVGRATTAAVRASTTGRGCSEPTARIAACGGLMTAEKLSTPYIPRLETENVPADQLGGGDRAVADLGRQLTGGRGDLAPSDLRVGVEDGRDDERVVGGDGDPDVDARVAPPSSPSR